jgi:hypothetical protein
MKNRDGPAVEVFIIHEIGEAWHEISLKCCAESEGTGSEKTNRSRLPGWTYTGKKELF